MGLFTLVNTPLGSGLARFRAAHAERSTQLQGLPWHYWSTGDRPRGLLLLGAAPSLGDSSYELFNQFAPTHHVVSPSYPPAATIGAVVEGLVRLMDHERLDTADVHGEGLGAGIAHVLARRYPDRVGRIALASFGLHSRWHRFVIHAFAAAMRLLPYTLFQQRWARRMRAVTSTLDGTRRSDADALVADLADRLSRSAALGQLRLLTDLVDHPLTYGLADPLQRDGSVLLLYAGDDPGFDRDERVAFERSWPGASVHTFQTGGRHLALTRPGEYARALSRFFSPPAPSRKPPPSPPRR